MVFQKTVISKLYPFFYMKISKKCSILLFSIKCKINWWHFFNENVLSFELCFHLTKVLLPHSLETRLTMFRHSVYTMVRWHFWQLLAGFVGKLSVNLHDLYFWLRFSVSSRSIWIIRNYSKNGVEVSRIFNGFLWRSIRKLDTTESWKG